MTSMIKQPDMTREGQQLTSMIKNVTWLIEGNKWPQPFKTSCYLLTSMIKNVTSLTGGPQLTSLIKNVMWLTRSPKATFSGYQSYDLNA